ncbi:hypothetical protein [Wolbachia endosymbiont of Trichogramma kaykai]|uniref:hypothetical protein n=1 Tax=Wolbachia endosymbiont of Trichogramma kaykai TaxID=444066 RepID=UPI00389124D3
MRKRETTNKQEMDGPTVRIVSDLESIKQNRRVEFLIKGENLTVEDLSISSRAAEMGLVTGIVNSIDIPQAIRESTIDGIILALKSGEIEKGKEYNYREFKKIYLKNLVDELGEDSSKKKLKERTDENSQLRESTTEEIDYQMQEDVTIESAYLTKQEFDFASSKVTTKEINDVINEIEESNASY